MKNKFIVIVGIIFLCLIGITWYLLNNKTEEQNESVENMGKKNYVELKVNDRVLTIELEDNSSAKAFLEKLKQDNIEINAEDYGNFEKFGDLGLSLPTNDSNITTEAGDLILYEGDKITLYYDTNTRSFNKLSKVKDVTEEELKNILGTGSVKLIFFMPDLTENTGKGEFNFKTKTVLLNSGYEMPINGLGTYSLTGDTCYNAILSALESGVRLIDTAYMYGNEKEIGRAIRDSEIPGEEIFLITKIYPSQYDDAKSAIDMSFDKLGLDYIYMMLLHHPGTNDVTAYKVMEEYVVLGKIRSIGLSNWYVEELQEFLPKISITPSLVQNEIHPFYQENDIIPYIQNLGIVVQGWYPLGSRGHTSKLLNNETIVKIAKNHNVSSVQVILRWNLQKGVVVIPGSSNPEHIKENTELYNFELTYAEMQKIKELDKNEKHDWY